MVNLSAISLWALCVVAAPEVPKLNRYEFAEVQMGSSFKLVLYAADEPTANVAARAAFDRVRELNGIMSDYDEQSELMRLCRSAKPGHPARIGEDLFAVLSQAQRLSEQSDGAFDVTLGPVVRLWRRTKRQKELPSDELLQNARQLVGFRQLRLDPRAKTAEFLTAGLQLDLGGIAKGYAADEVLKLLAQRGITRVLIAASGDLLAGAAPPDDESWRIGVAPLEAEAPPSRYLRLNNRAVSTSGDAFQFVEIAGQRYSHIVDPRTGLGLVRRSSVTVVADTSTAADSLATAVSVLGPRRGLELIETIPGAAAMFVCVNDQGRTETFESARWKQLTIEK